MVFSKSAEGLTIVMPSGCKKKALVKNSTLRLGSKCNVAIDNSTGKITEVWGIDAPSSGGVGTELEAHEPLPSEAECYSLDEQECSREPEE